MFRKPVTAEEVLASKVVCEPLHLFMLCSPNEGAAAVVLRAGDGGVQLRAAALRSHLPGHVLNEGSPLCGLVDGDPDAADGAGRGRRLRGGRARPRRHRRGRVPGHRRGP